jgi:hypothetical protein
MSLCLSLFAATGGSGLSRITSATVTAVGPFTVTLVWTANPTADRFQVSFATGANPDRIQVAPPPVGYGKDPCMHLCVCPTPPVAAKADPVGTQQST